MLVYAFMATAVYWIALSYYMGKQTTIFESMDFENILKTNTEEHQPDNLSEFYFIENIPRY